MLSYWPINKNKMWSLEVLLHDREDLYIYMSCEGQCKVAIATDMSGKSLSQFACPAVKLVEKFISIWTSNISPTHIMK